MGVSKNMGKTPQIIHLKIGVSVIFTIHFGGKIPLFLETSIKTGGPFLDFVSQRTFSPLLEQAMRPKIFLLVAELTRSSEVFLHLQSVQPRRVLVEEPASGQPVETGCKFLGTEALYQCSLNELTDAPQAIPQLFSLRVDCRGADGDFRNLTLFDNKQVCGRMGYKKYGRKSGLIRRPSTRLPFHSDRIITLDKGDVIDIQCVLLPVSWKRSFKAKSEGGWRELKKEFTFRLILDGVFEMDVEYWQMIVPFNFLIANAAGQDDCQDAISRAYKWTMTLQETQKNTHWIRLASPKMGLPLQLPKFDLPEFQEGDLGFVGPELGVFLVVFP